jgi:tetratricopeptide (TPR) repeat protein
MIAVIVAALVLIWAPGGAQDVVRAEAPNAPARPAALAAWEWPDCARVLSTESETFADAMCRAAAARTRFQSATDVRTATAGRYRVEALTQFRRAVTSATSNIEKRVALSELATAYSMPPGDLAQAELAWREVIALDPDNPTGYLALAHAQNLRGAHGEEEATLLGARQALPRSRDIAETLARFYRLRGRPDESIRVFREFADQDPQDAKRLWLLATWYWQLQTTPDLTPRAAELTAAGLKAIQGALLLQPDDVDALTCKYTLLRRQAELAGDPAARDAALADARQIRARILELKR